MGNGRSAAKLTDDQWKDFNNYQRAHYNYLENVAMAISFELMAGVFYPRAAAISGVVYMIGRHIYGVMYQRYGPKHRHYGGFLNLALLAEFGMIVYGSLRTLGYVA
jgi:glutathione S-transferase